jgi:hypothetical protein
VPFVSALEARPLGSEASAHGWEADELRRACASICRSCRMPQSTLKRSQSHGGWKFGCSGELSAATTPAVRCMLIAGWVGLAVGRTSHPVAGWSECTCTGTASGDSQGLQRGWMREDTCGTDAGFWRANRTRSSALIEPRSHSSYSLRDRRRQSDVPPLTSLRGGLQSGGRNILGASMMGGR